MEKRRFKITEISKKIICMIIVLVMLAGNFVSPVMSIAAELNNSKNAANTTTAEENANNEKIDEGEKESANKASEEANNEADNQAKIDEIEAAFDAAKEKENNGEAKATENAEDNQAQTNNTRSLKSTAPVLRGANAPQSDKIEDRITPDIKAEVTEKTKNDAYEINKLETQFLLGAAKDENGNLVWKPTSSASGHEFRFRVNYALSGLKELPAEAVKITIPKSILRNRNGNYADKYEMSLPTNQEYDGTTEFAYIENGDYLVIYNPNQIASGVNGYFEVSYATNTSTLNYRDYDKTKTNTIPNGGTASDPFNAVITVKTTVNNREDTLTKISNDKNIFIDTNARIQSVQKYQPTIYRDWDPTWMQEVPADSDQYYYLIWQVYTSVQSGTQPYKFTLEDTVTNLTEGTSAEDYQFVGYRLSGERYFSNKNTDPSASTGTSRTDYVLTRHKKSTFSGIDYQLKNTVTATVEPIDQVDPSSNAKSSNIFNWKSEFKVPTGHFDLYKYGNNRWKYGYWDYANYDLDKLQSGEVNELKGFKYIAETVGYAYPWTLKEGGSSTKPEDYGQNPVNYDTWDDTLYLENDENPMNYNDYYLEYLTYSINNSDVNYDDFHSRFNTTGATYADDETITFYAKFEDGQDWIQIGTFNLKTKETTSNYEYVSEITTSKITFKDGVHATGWRYTTSNKHYYTDIMVTPYFVLTNSEYVAEKIQDKDKIQIKNIVKTNITNYKNETIFAAEANAIDYARVTYYDSKISKSVSAGSNNVAKKRYTVRWKVNAYETATGGDGSTEYIRQDSGKIYDLIPAGGEIDLNSIQVQTENGFLPENEYSFETIPNYKNSGRTLLIVKADVQAQYYTLNYATIHSWDSIKDFGRNVLNPVAYETGNEKITKGFPDNGGNLSNTNKEFFTNLDETTDANKFIYAEQSHNINALTATVSGLYKKVKNAKETEYSYNTQVESNGKYTYQLRYQNTFMNKAKDLILYDSIENFKVVDSDAGTTKTSGWKGTLLSIDLSQLRQKGIEPVVYVSTEDDLNLEEHNDLTDSSIWKKATFTTDLTEAKAIAIDLRKDKNGNDFVLEPGDSVSAILNMKAPSQLSDEQEESPYTYNNVYLSGMLMDDQEEISDFFIHQDYTTVKYYVIADVPVVKVNEDDRNEKIKGITFRLWGTSIYGTNVDKLVTSDKNGFIVFKDIEAGEYKLQEYEANDDWFMDYTEYQVKVTKNGEVYINEGLVNAAIPFVVTNKPRIHADVKFTKKNLVTKAALEGAKFKLSGTSNYGNEVLTYKISDANGEVKFDGLEYGTYELIEISAPDGYVLGNDKWKVIVDENGNYDIQKQILENVTRSETTERIEYEDVVKYSHTPNINDSGYASNNYENNLSRTDTVTIPGAEQLEVTVYYSTESTSFDWVCVYGNNVSYPSDSNISSSISGKLGGGKKSYSTVNSSGYQKACSKYTTTVPGDTVKFYFKSDGSGNYYGYYAIITAYNVPVTKYDTRTWKETVERYESIYDRGTYSIYNEPLHDVRFIKKDEYSGENIAGAKFRLYGVSDYGNRVDEQATSSSIGFVEFTDLESGTYLLQETYVPEVTDEQGNTISYVLNNNKYIVNIKKDKTVTINGINKNEYGEYVFYNKRNKGQITITKKWIDQKNNDQREEPVVHISNNKPDAPERVQYLRKNYEASGPLYCLTRNYKNIITGSFARNTQLDEEEVIELGAKRLDKDYANPNAKYKIYGWIDDEGNCWWWSNADYIKMTNDSNLLFHRIEKIKGIDLSGINMDEVTNMEGMFLSCKNLIDLDLSGLDTSNVTNMNHMFSGCNSLTKLDVSNFNTSNVTYMYSMFYDCSSLTELDLNNFNTSNVTNMGQMFYGCSSLTELDLSNFDTSNVTQMEFMFAKCSSLTELDVSSFITSNVTSMYGMFGELTGGCSSLTKLDISNFNTSNVTQMGRMFANCSSLTELDLSNFDTSNVTSMLEMFTGCSSLTELDLSSFDTSNVTEMRRMFEYCSSLTELDLSNFDTSNVTWMCQMFYGCSSLTKVDLSSFDTSNVTDMSFVFYGCSSLTELDLSNFDTSNVTWMCQMFYGCSSLTKVDLSSFDTSNVTDMSFVFYGCSSLTELDLSNFDTSKVTQMQKMFAGCSNLETIYVSESFVTSGITSNSNGKYMFTDCTSIVGENGTRYNSRYVDKSYARIDKPGQKGYFTEKIITTGALNNNVFIDDAFRDLFNINYTKTQTDYTYLNPKIELLAPEVDSEDEENNSSETITYSSAETNYDDLGNEIHWIKDGDTWTYTFYVDDPNATWYVWEDEMEGYETNYSVWTPGIVENQAVTIVNVAEEKRKTVALEYGSLSISKTLIERDENSNETVLTATDDNTQFMFTVKLTALAGREEQISGIKVFGEYIFNDGICSIPLKAGETVTINGIPEKLSYEVTEEEIDGYETFVGATGTIVKDEVSVVEAINYKDKEDESTTPDPQIPLTSFTLRKEVIGNAEEDEPYSFEIVLDNLQPDTEYTLSDGKIFTSDSTGSANISITLKNNEEVTVQDIPVGTRYKIYEHPGDYIQSYVIDDENNAGMINNSSKNNIRENKDLSTNTEIADSEENITVTFRSRRIVTQNLKIQKVVTDESDTNSYTFDIEFANLEPGSSFNSSIGKIIAEDDGTANLQIYLAGGEEAEFYGVPVGTTYTVKELASSAIASYTITDANGTNQIVSDSKANTAAKKALSTERETVNQGEDVTVTFINDTVNQEPDSVSASLGVTKNVVDKHGEKVENCDETFTFELSTDDETNPMPEKTSVTVKGNGTASFGTITFSETGTYTYTVVEKAGSNEECQYDNSTYTITYEVTNLEGLLEITKIVKKNGFESGAVEFTNIVEKEEEPEPVKPDEPADPEDPTNPENPTDPTKPEEGNKEEPAKEDEGKVEPTKEGTKQEESIKPIGPQTGDKVMIVMSILVVAGIVLIVTFKRRRK